MCQLTLINTKSPTFNKMALYMIAARNSKYSHKDGFGFFNPLSGVWRTEFAASSLTNAGNIMRDIQFDNRPVMGHVRNASKSIAVKIENVHPFETDKIVLMHNGTLWFEDELDVSYVGESRESDSQRFCAMLTKQLETEPDFVTSFNICMSHCKGKFAMIIYVKASGDFYVCRGKTATLHYADVLMKDETVGFIINTERLSIEDEWTQFTNTAQLLGAPVFTLGKVSLLSAETIWKVDKKTLVEVGKTTENPLPVRTAIVPMAATVSHDGSMKPAISSGVINSDPKYDKLQSIANFMDREFLSLTSMDILWQIIFETPLLLCEMWQVDAFNKYAIGALGSRKGLRDILIKHKVDVIPASVYAELSFPLGINSDAKLTELMLEDILARKEVVE